MNNVIPINQRTNSVACFMPQSFAELKQLSEIIANSDLAPKDFKGKPGNVMIAVMMGLEVGLKPMQAVQNIAVINGRPCVWGDSMLAIVQASGLLVNFEEFDDGKEATCIVRRKGDKKDHIVKFSMDDAKKAGLSDKPGPWKQYPQRMRQMRARGFAIRDKFSDVLKGLNLAEEVMDYIDGDYTDASQEPENTVPLNEPANYEDALNSAKNKLLKSIDLLELKNNYIAALNAFRGNEDAVKQLTDYKDEIKQNMIDSRANTLRCQEKLEALDHLYKQFVDDYKNVKDEQAIKQLEIIYKETRNAIEFFDGDNKGDVA